MAYIAIFRSAGVTPETLDAYRYPGVIPMEIDSPAWLAGATVVAWETPTLSLAQTQADRLASGPGVGSRVCGTTGELEVAFKDWGI